MEGLLGEKKRVVVVGGGAAGSLIAKTLQDHSDVFLIDLKEFYEIPWTNLRSMVEPSFAERTVINHSDYLLNAHVITSAATNITQNEVLTAQGRQIAYDYLVIATGHVDSGPYTKAERLSHYEAGYWNLLEKRLEKSNGLVEFEEGREVILGQSVKLSSVSDGAYETSGGETIVADCHFLCTGNPIGSSWLKDTLLKDNLDMHGRLMVDANLRVRGHNNIFAIGDITDIPEIKQGYLAQAHALVAAKNLKLLIKGENDCKLSTYRPASPMALVSLGRREGVAQVMCLTMGGRVPGMIKSGDLFVGKTRKQLGLNSTLP
ncbi:hypothetical protein DH2020_030323 [Rehmannia glutinosa]|uniref:FAD/NAD(P)-binding domain-containing protein n=1 Tax=Rehmannia glutinosa TaxID=99300 RepID=A0ABR0VQ94_REHGL